MGTQPSWIDSPHLVLMTDPAVGRLDQFEQSDLYRLTRSLRHDLGPGCKRACWRPGHGSCRHPSRPWHAGEYEADMLNRRMCRADGCAHMSDQRQPGRYVARPMVMPPSVTHAKRPSSKVRVSSQSLRCHSFRSVQQGVEHRPRNLHPLILFVQSADALERSVWLTCE